MSEEIKKVNGAEKLHRLQAKIGAIPKDSQNPHFRNRYFDINTLLEVLKPLLSETGLVITQPIVAEGGRNTLKTVITDCGTGEVVEQGSILLPENPDPQKMGSAITYFRRYSLQSMLLLQAEDDDGNGASVRAAQEIFAQPSGTHSPAQTSAPQHKPMQGEETHHVTINSVKTTQKTGRNGKPYWQVQIDTPEMGGASNLIFEEDFIPKWQQGERATLTFSMNGKYMNWAWPAGNPYQGN